MQPKNLYSANLLFIYKGKQQILSSMRELKTAPMSFLKNKTKLFDDKIQSSKGGENQNRIQKWRGPAKNDWWVDSGNRLPGLEVTSTRFHLSVTLDKSFKLSVPVSSL